MKLINVLNTQYTYGTDFRKLNYEAIYSCFEKINANFPNRRLGAPKIGCNLAGGEWAIVEAMMKVALKDLDLITVLEL